MIFNDVNMLMRWQTEPASTKTYVLKNGVLQDGYTTSSFDFTTASSYSSGNYIQITSNVFGLVKFNFNAPKSYLYIAVYSYTDTSSIYSIRAYNNNTRLGDLSSWYDTSGTTVKATPTYLQTTQTLRQIPVCNGVVGIASYFGGYRITDIWFSDLGNDY